MKGREASEFRNSLLSQNIHGPLEKAVEWWILHQKPEAKKYKYYQVQKACYYCLNLEEGSWQRRWYREDGNTPLKSRETEKRKEKTEKRKQKREISKGLFGRYW